MQSPVKSLEERLRFETLLADLSSRFVNLPAADVDSAVEDAQRQVVEALDLDRTTLFQIDDDGSQLVVTHSWARPGFEPFPGLSSADLPWCAQKILSGQHVCFSRVEDLPAEATVDAETIRKYGPKSNVTFPLFRGGTVVGSLSFGAMREHREWPDEIVNRLRLVAEILANAIARKLSEQELHAALAEVSRLKEKLELENTYLREEVRPRRTHEHIVGQSAGMRRALEQVEQVGPTDSTVLLLGETGTGKELLASAIHEASSRRDRAMVRVNCAAIPTALIESELFGREKGAYTGALSKQIGRFELADGSTIFLDEVGELELEVQVKLLRVIEERRIERLGNPRPVAIDVRIIAATNTDLAQAVRQGRFREDLFYRLNVFPIEIPPLRTRREDIPPLVWSFVHELGMTLGKTIESISAESMQALLNYAWPGNVRELRNVIERALIVNNGPLLVIEIPHERRAEPLTLAKDDAERAHVLSILEMSRWRIRGRDGAAELLKMKPTTLESRMAKLGIRRPDR